MGKGRLRYYTKDNGGRGSTLGWVVVVMMVVMILMMSALTMSASHIYRYQRRHNRRQIQMTALSAAVAMAKDLEHPGGEGGFGKIVEGMLEDGEEGEILLTGLDERMGEVFLLYRYDGEYLELTVRVRIGREAEETKLILRQKDGEGDGQAWQVMGYGLDEALYIEEMKDADANGKDVS